MPQTGTVYNGVHSITFAPVGATVKNGRLVGKNTWTDWHLIPSTRPSVAQAPPTFKYVEIPGKLDGPLDLTEYLTGGVVYGQRSGSFDFLVDNDHEDWLTILRNINAYLHGQKMLMVLEDEADRGVCYEGRFSVNDWKSQAKNSSVVIEYKLNPYKRMIYTPTNWIWDTFIFDTMNTDMTTREL